MTPSPTLWQCTKHKCRNGSWLGKENNCMRTLGEWPGACDPNTLLFPCGVGAAPSIWGMLCKVLELPSSRSPTFSRGSPAAQAALQKYSLWKCSSTPWELCFEQRKSYRALMLIALKSEMWNLGMLQALYRLNFLNWWCEDNSASWWFLRRSVAKCSLCMPRKTGEEGKKKVNLLKQGLNGENKQG